MWEGGGGCVHTVPVSLPPLVSISKAARVSHSGTGLASEPRLGSGSPTVSACAL